MKASCATLANPKSELMFRATPVCVSVNTSCTISPLLFSLYPIFLLLTSKYSDTHYEVLIQIFLRFVSIFIGTNLKFNLVVSNNRYYWNFGDETIAAGKNVVKSYIHPGTFNIQLIVTAKPDAAGVAREACVSKNITIMKKQ